MSRLVYESLSSENEVESCSSGQDSGNEEEEAFNRAETLAMSSYTLHDLDKSGLRRNGKRRKVLRGMTRWEREVEEIDGGERNGGSDSAHEVEVVDVDSSDIELENEYCGEDKKLCTTKSTPSTPMLASCGNISSRSPRPSSHWLTKFLSCSRTPTTPPPPPPNSPKRETYLQLFDQSVRDRGDKLHGKGLENEKVLHIGDVETPDSDGSDEDDPFGTHGDDNEIEFDATPSDEETTKIYLFNLPYTITGNQIKSTARKFGVGLSNIVLNKDSSGRPAGSAVATCDALISMSTGKPFDKSESKDDWADMCVLLLSEKQFGSRPVRVHTAYSFREEQMRRRQNNLENNTGRYFAQDDISLKCYACGEVGHKVQDCWQEENVANPCHLCASIDHDAANCHNIVCFQCNGFGHHSRDCSMKKGGKYSGRCVICTLCGGFTHDSRRCHQKSVSARKSAEGPLETLECMCCGKFGHAICLRLPPVKSELADGDWFRTVNIFCPKCGEAGHHADYVVNEYQEPSCRQPHYNANKNKRKAESTNSTKKSKRKSSDALEGNERKRRVVIKSTSQEGQTLGSGKAKGKKKKKL